MIHYYKLGEKKYVVLRQIILAICLLFSLANLVFMITSIIVKTWINLLYVLLIWLGLLIIRITSSFLVYNLEYKFNEDSLVILKSYPIFKKSRIDFNYDKIDSIVEYNGKNEDKLISYCPKSCAFKKYVIKYQNSAYLIALDEYGYCMLNRSTNDLFR